MPIDPRTLPVTSQIGTKLRDAAVDPRESDFLPPTNAGATGELGNPHGPTVISPGLHGDESVRTIVPGPVSSDPEEQSATETESVTDWQPQTDPVETLTISGATTVAVSATISLTAEAERAITGEEDVTEIATWSSGTPACATVSSAGVVTGVSAGAVVITAAYGGKTDTHNVTVTA